MSWKEDLEEFEFLEETILDDVTGLEKTVHRANPHHPNFASNLKLGHTAPGTPVQGATVIGAEPVAVAPGVQVVPTPVATAKTS